jgi:cytoplasmic iron level regulating protein YaaA (DUF328/UPF0246 family)
VPAHRQPSEELQGNRIIFLSGFEDQPRESGNLVAIRPMLADRIRYLRRTDDVQSRLIARCESRIERYSTGTEIQIQNPRLTAMLILLSPAKTLDESPYEGTAATEPVFLDKSEILVRKLNRLSMLQIKALMGISENLARLNKTRYDGFEMGFTSDNAKPAALMFMGDVYEGMQFSEFSQDDQLWSQNHLRILSGLYGLLRPLDLIQPHRLEMGTRLGVGRGRNLYEFWDTAITEQINTAVVEQGGNLIVNLASNEYFNAVKFDKLQAQLVTPAFKEERDGQFKLISFFAKKARGAMARHLLTNRITDSDGIVAFAEDGYSYNKSLSEPAKPVFTRAS